MSLSFPPFSLLSLGRWRLEAWLTHFPIRSARSYFYAIATFSSIAAAEYVMNECNGTEFERTANIMDLSYVPEDMEFADDEIRYGLPFQLRVTMRIS